MEDLHYLESLDSVRAPVPRGGEQSPSPSSGQMDQAVVARCEALLALAFGRDIVIPQSFVLDSYAAQDLVETISKAEALAASGSRAVAERALRIHLFKAPRFVDAAQAMFDGVASGTWSSSMYPELEQTDRARRIAKKIVTGKRSNPLEWLPDWRSDLFDATWNYFRTAQADDSRRVAVPRPYGPTLDAQVRELVRQHISGSTTNNDGPVEAIRLLISRSGDDEPFRARSGVHSDAPWTGRAGDPSARQIVGSSAVMREVVEIVDTMYNRSLLGSIGPHVFASFTTRVGPWAEVREEGGAQDLALDAGDSRRSHNVRGAFEIAFDRASLGSALEVVPLLIDVETFAAVLKARQRTDWAASFKRLKEAATGSFADRNRAVEAHIRLIARVLNGRIRIENEGSDVWLEFRKRGFNVANVGVSALLAAFNPWLGLSAVVPAMGAWVWPALRDRHALEVTHGSIGKLVRPEREQY